jgi:hypothetical protein
LGALIFFIVRGRVQRRKVVFGYAIAFFLTMMTIHDVAAAEDDLVPTAGYKEQPETDPLLLLESSKLK